MLSNLLLQMINKSEFNSVLERCDCPVWGENRELYFNVMWGTYYKCCHQAKKVTKWFTGLLHVAWDIVIFSCVGIALNQSRRSLSFQKRFKYNYPERKQSSCTLKTLLGYTYVIIRKTSATTILRGKPRISQTGNSKLGNEYTENSCSPRNTQNRFSPTFTSPHCIYFSLRRGWGSEENSIRNHFLSNFLFYEFLLLYFIHSVHIYCVVLFLKNVSIWRWDEWRGPGRLNETCAGKALK